MNSLLLLLGESTMVGFYTLIMGFFLSFLILPTKKNISFVLFFFVLGFLKHDLGFWLGLQTFYCNKGEKCKKVHNNNHQTWKAKEPSLLENVGEGILFVLFGWMLQKLFFITYTHIYVTSFFIGFLLHVISEFSGVHTFFCTHRCIQK
jgi:hypothetical protein